MMVNLRCETSFYPDGKLWKANLYEGSQFKLPAELPVPSVFGADGNPLRIENSGDIELYETGRLESTSQSRFIQIPWSGRTLKAQEIRFDAEGRITAIENLDVQAGDSRVSVRSSPKLPEEQGRLRN